MSSPESAVLFKVSHGVATITLNRPDQMNTINGDLGARSWTRCVRFGLGKTFAWRC
jgi:hypothetical protein